MEAIWNKGVFLEHLHNSLDEYIVSIAKSGKRSEEASFSDGDRELDNFFASRYHIWQFDERSDNKTNHRWE